MGLNDELLALVRAYAKQHPEHEDVMQAVLDSWNPHQDMTSRKTYPAHFTASAVVLHADAVLMIHHRTLEKWLIPGGHIENGETPAQAALRELSEETGLMALLAEEAVLDIDCHTIPENPNKDEPEHLHIDLKFLVKADVHSLKPAYSEVNDVKWMKIADLPPSYVRVSRKLSSRKLPLQTP
jgi:8-oxo-dGTP pyrophosphatase MutT (NUDIX family)